MSKWQPIETAPKDGTRVLFYGGSKEMSFAHPAIVDGWIDSRGGFVHGYRSPLRITHWMPLPYPPKAEGR